MAFATLHGPNGQKKKVTVGSAEASKLQSQGWGLTKGSYKPAQHFESGLAAPGTPNKPRKMATLYGPNGARAVVDVGSADASRLQSEGWGLSPGSYKVPTPGGTTPGNVPPDGGGLPGDPIAEEIIKKLTPEKRAEFEKNAYHDYLRDYGIEIPELTAKYGLPAGYNPATTQFGIAEAGFGAQEALLPQNLAAAFEQYDINKRSAIGEWEALGRDIEAGRVEAGSDLHLALERNLQAKTEAIDQTRRGLSSKGTLFGGLSQRRTTEAERPYLQQASDIQTGYERRIGELSRREQSGKSQYDLAMETYLGNKKGSQVQYGIDNTGQEGIQNTYGGGVWDPTTQTFSGVTYGLTPQEAQQKGLTFFGTDPYNILINKQAKKKELENLMRAGIGSQIQQQEYNYLNY